MLNKNTEKLVDDFLIWADAKLSPMAHAKLCWAIENLIKEENRLTENVVLTQDNLINAQIELIGKIRQEREEAIRNLQTASAQWEVWRKQMEMADVL
jgi:hypothetical protein